MKGYETLQPQVVLGGKRSVLGDIIHACLSWIYKLDDLMARLLWLTVKKKKEVSKTWVGLMCPSIYVSVRSD